MTEDHYNEEYYEKLSGSYLNMDIWMENRINNVCEMLQIRPFDIILDAGCGIGTFTFESSKSAFFSIGLDLSILSLSTCIRLQNHKAEHNNVNFVRADVSNIPIRDGIITTIICADLIEHLIDPIFNLFLKECYRTLFNNGYLVIYTPSEHHLFEILRRNNLILKKDKTHIGFKSMKFITASLKSSNFEVEKQYYKESHVPLFNLLEMVLTKIPKVGNLFRRRICITALKNTK